RRRRWRPGHGPGRRRLAPPRGPRRHGRGREEPLPRPRTGPRRGRDRPQRPRRQGSGGGQAPGFTGWLASRGPLPHPAKWLGCVSMRTDKLTIKAQEAVADVRDIAAGRGNPEIASDHLLLALLNQEEGVVPRLLAKVGADPKQVAAAVEKELESQPVVR